MLQILFWSFIILHVLAAIVPIRKWPLTDYPMFSKPVHQFNQISRLSLETVYADKVIPWERNDYGAIGLNDHRLQVYTHDVFNARVEDILKGKVDSNPRLQNAVSIRIIRKTFVPQIDQLKVNQEIVREIPISQLRKKSCCVKDF